MLIIVPDTNVLIDQPDLVTTLAAAPSQLRVVILFPVLRELDRLRRLRNGIKKRDQERGRAAYGAIKSIETSLLPASANVDCVVERFDGIDPREDGDIQIVDSLVQLAERYR